MTMTAVMLACGLGVGVADARHQYPPRGDSACGKAMVAYLQAIKPKGVGVVRISSFKEQDGRLAFGLYGTWAKLVEGVNLTNMAAYEGDAHDVQRYYDNSQKYGMWLLVTPGYDGLARLAQVFVEGREATKPTCEAVFQQAISFDPMGVPADIFEH